MRTRSVLFAAVVLAIGIARPGRGEERTTQPSFYGGPMLVTDAAGIGLMVSSAASRDFVLGFGSWIGYAVSGPIVHWANGEVQAGFGSLALRAGLPFAGAMIGSQFPARSTTDCTGCSHESLGLAPAVPGMLAGAAVGALVASAIDIGLLAHHADPPERPPRRVTLLLGANSVALSARF
jgi:hypothetical protein